MKSRLSLIILFLAIFMLSVSSPASAAAPTVKLNGQVMTFDVEPVVENGRTLVPMRAIFEALGSTVSWDQNTSTITATAGDITIKLQIGNTTVYKNNQAITLDVPPKVNNGRTLVPLRFVGESLGATVNWDGPNNMVVITSQTSLTEPLKTYTNEEISKTYDNSVVSISVYDERGKFLERGTGIIINSNGKVVTNYHLIAGAISGKVKLNNGKIADILSLQNYDVAADLAILQINASNLNPIPLGDSDIPRGGENAVVIANPWGKENVHGYIRLDDKGSPPVDYEPIYTGFSINIGSSGAAFINLHGQLIGIATSHWEGPNFFSSYMIPINKLKPLLTQDRNLKLTDLAKTISSPTGKVPICRYAAICANVSDVNEPLDEAIGNVFSKDISKLYFVMRLDRPLQGQLWTFWIYMRDGKTMELVSRSYVEGNGQVGQEQVVGYLKPGDMNLKPGKYALHATLVDGSTLITMLEFTLK